MCLKIRVASLVLLAACTGVCALAQDPQATDPVAEAARQARAQEKKEGKPKKVYTNDDSIFKSSTPAPPPADAATGAPNTAANADKDKAKDDKDKDAENDPKSEAYWRKRFAAQRSKIANAEKELDVLQRELDKDQLQYYPDPQKALMQGYTRSDINDRQAKIDAKKKEIDSLNQGLSDLEDDLRKAGGDPGWAR